MVQTEIRGLFHAPKYENVQEKGVIESDLPCSRGRSVILNSSAKEGCKYFSKVRKSPEIVCTVFFPSTFTLATC